MDKAKLIEMGLTEELAAKVMESLDGAYVTKSRFNAVNAEQQKAHETELHKMRIDSAVDMALTAARARNNTAARALMAEKLIAVLEAAASINEHPHQARQGVFC